MLRPETLGIGPAGYYIDMTSIIQSTSRFERIKAQNHCYSTVRAACSEGAMQFQLLIGQRVASEKTMSITAAALQRIEIDVPESTWRRGLDVARKPALPYRTALFTLRVEVTCNEPEAFSPATERYVDVADVRSFIAGFASGE
jgi:hypothetical protein